MSKGEGPTRQHQIPGNTWGAAVIEARAVDAQSRSSPSTSPWLQGQHAAKLHTSWVGPAPQVHLRLFVHDWPEGIRRTQHNTISQPILIRVQSSLVSVQRGRKNKLKAG